MRWKASVKWAQNDLTMLTVKMTFLMPQQEVPQSRTIQTDRNILAETRATLTSLWTKSNHLLGLKWHGKLHQEEPRSHPRTSIPTISPRCNRCLWCSSTTMKILMAKLCKGSSSATQPRMTTHVWSVPMGPSSSQSTTNTRQPILSKVATFWCRLLMSRSTLWKKK